jgi:hypothetical protein
MMTSPPRAFPLGEATPARVPLPDDHGPGPADRFDGDVAGWRDLELDDMLAQSFPASDPPSSTSGIARVQPRGRGSNPPRAHRVTAER